MKRLLGLPFDPIAEAELGYRLKYGVWIFGMASWLFGISDRSIATFSDGVVSGIELMQLFTAMTFALAWYFLKPVQRPQRVFMTEYTGTLNGARYAAEDVIAFSWEEAELIASKAGARVIGEKVSEIAFD